MSSLFNAGTTENPIELSTLAIVALISLQPYTNYTIRRTDALDELVMERLLKPMGENTKTKKCQVVMTVRGIQVRKRLMNSIW